LRCCYSGRRSPLQNNHRRHGACHTGPSGPGLGRVWVLGLGRVRVLGLERVRVLGMGRVWVLGMGRVPELALGLELGLVLLAQHNCQEPG
jgi:hypothetical protein